MGNDKASARVGIELALEGRQELLDSIGDIGKQLRDAISGGGSPYNPSATRYAAGAVLAPGEAGAAGTTQPGTGLVPAAGNDRGLPPGIMPTGNPAAAGLQALAIQRVELLLVQSLGSLVVQTAGSVTLGGAGGPAGAIPGGTGPALLPGPAGGTAGPGTPGPQGPPPEPGPGAAAGTAAPGGAQPAPAGGAPTPTPAGGGLLGALGLGAGGLGGIAAGVGIYQLLHAFTGIMGVGERYALAGGAMET